MLAENELARLRTTKGVEVRFQSPGGSDASSWEAFGLLTETTPGLVSARVSVLGDFSISLEFTDSSSGRLTVVLDNVGESLVVEHVAPDGAVREVPSGPGLRRQLVLTDAEIGTHWIRGSHPCPPRYRIAALGDIQTGQSHMRRILEQLAQEAEDAAARDEPLLGLLILGDLTETSRDDEFAALTEMLEGAPVPVAVTTGNHDILREVLPLHNKTFGPGNYAFDLCRTHVVMLDTGNGSLATSIEGRVYEFLDRDRVSVPFLIAGTHYPPHAGLTGDGWSREDQAQHLLAALESAGADAVLAGHIHTLDQFTRIPVAGGALREFIVGTGGADQGAGQPRHGYLRLTFDKKMSACFVEVPAPGSGPVPREPAVPRCANDP